MSETVKPTLASKDYAKSQAMHREQAELPIKEKMRVLLEMQKQDLPLLARLRPLKWYEKPWDIEP